MNEVRDQRAINVIRGLCIDMVEQANSGHPGTPVDIAPVAYTLFQQFLRFDPNQPLWPDRDRFILSEGHASTLLYALLHLARVRGADEAGAPSDDPAVSVTDLRSFRELGSRCPGHPEFRWTAGVEATTGPLGQGVATSVGVALAGRWLAARYNTPEHPLFTYDVYALAGDGCFMEGVASEAASLAGHLQLANLCWIYDCNRVTIEGHIDITFTEDVAARFLAYGWNVVTVADANDTVLVARAFAAFKAERDRPTLVLVHSHIGYGTPFEDTPRAHGEPLGAAGVAATKAFFDLPADTPFYLPDDAYACFAEQLGARSAAASGAWDAQLAAYRRAEPARGAELAALLAGELPEDWDDELTPFPADPTGLATRDSSGQVLNALARRVPWVVGGAADLSPSTLTRLLFDGAGDQQPATPDGRNVHFGIREHAAAAAANGLALGGLRPFWSTFFIFSDYARPAIRLSALMELPVVHVFTHDSIGLGQDGPTHQPVEQLAALRAMPGISVFRPADANEVVACWRVIAQMGREPAALVLTRQPLPTLDRTTYQSVNGVARGGYVLYEPAEPAVLVLLASGSEVHLALAGAHELAGRHVPARVVSMVCWELFERQDATYRDAVLPPALRARVAIEEASGFGWERYVGTDGAVVAMHTFGASAPIKELQNKFGFTPGRVVEVALATLAKTEARS